MLKPQKADFIGHIGQPRKNPCNWIPHFCGKTHKTDAIAIALKDGRERQSHSATYAESRKAGQ